MEAELRISAREGCQISLRKCLVAYQLLQQLIANLNFIYLLLLMSLQQLPVHQGLLDRRVLPLRAEAVCSATHLAHHALFELPEVLRVQKLRVLKSNLRRLRLLLLR